MPFHPIAVVGQSCVLPGALSPEALWQGILANADLTGAADPARWRLAKELVLGQPGPPEVAYTDRGGYVTGFEQVWDPTGFQVPAAELAGLDPLVRWVLHTARQALGRLGEGKRVGAVLGNLSLPSDGLAAYAEHVLLGGFPAQLPATDPRNRFMSGLPAGILARALGLKAGAFALDAACASSLYAIKLACDRLADGEADVMLAGAVNRADDLFLHVGFSTLKALSPSGRSRPFHHEADGLLPAEGAAFVALKRLEDAVAAGDEILGVIRGVGLSNDGRATGMLVPDRDGQARAIQAAYDVSGVDPASVSLIECHATGTLLGDATELASLGRVFPADREVPLGSLKGNMGHPITVAGLAGLLKILAAMKAGTRPPGARQGEGDSIEALALSPFRLLTAAEPWPSEGPRRAALSAFGFGGNNAHLVVEEWQGQALEKPAGKPRGPVALVGLGARVGEGRDTADFARALFGANAGAGRAAGPIDLPLAGLRFPPMDLAAAQPQQLHVLAAAREALAGLAALPRERTAILVGMGCDAAIARYGLRWRLRGWAPPGTDAAWLREAQDAAMRELSAAGVVGSLPNVVANRLNAQFDLAGPSFSISAEENSGLVALRLALRGLRARELDAAVVGAVDLAAEPVQAAAAAALGLDDPADGSVVLVLQRLEDARAAGHPILAILPDEQAVEAEPIALGAGEAGLTPRLGHAHAAAGLLHVAAGALALRHGVWPAAPGLPARPLTQLGHVQVDVADVGGGHEGVALQAAGEPVAMVPGGPRVHLLAGPRGRVAVAARDGAQAEERLARARAWLAGEATAGDGVYGFEQPVEGELAFVFTGSAAAYPHMGAALLPALPEVAERWPGLVAAARPCFDDPTALGPLERLWGSSVLCQAHAVVTRELLGLKPAAVLGLSSGETNALLAMGAWRDLDALVLDFGASGAFQRVLGGSYEVLGERAAEGWSAWRVAAPAEALAHPAVRVTIKMGPEDTVIAGPTAACQELVLGRPAVPLGHDVVVHAPELAPFATTWRGLHLRDTRPVPGVRFYSHAYDQAYQPTADSAADALTGQALKTVDFPALVERAYADGVRIFVEHGPQGGLTSAIRRVLGDRPHLAVALDLATEDPLDQLAAAVAQLAAAGVPLDLEALNLRLAGAPPGDPGPVVSFPAHPPAFRLPSFTPEPVPVKTQPMPPAPALPPILGGPVATPAPQPQAAPQPLAAPLAVPPTPLIGDPALASIFDAQQRAQQAYLALMAQQAAVHQQFIAQSKAAFEALMARNGAPAPLAPVARAPVPVAAPTPFEAPKPIATPKPVQAQPPVAAPKPAPAPVAPPAPPPAAATSPVKGEGPTGPAFDRQQLEILASGKISEVFGPLFEQQDGYHRQVRMPEPPLLLADRVTGITGKPGSMGLGTIWTETDVKQDSWYLYDGVMPAGLMIESGQADLLLISWLGADFLNKSERVYRLLGCELTYHADPVRQSVLPRVGESLQFDIHVDGHAKQGAIRMFFFHYDCVINGHPRLTVRHGQAGFFTDAELGDSGGVLWDAETQEVVPNPRLAPPRVQPASSYTAAQVAAFAEGRVVECFGPAYNQAAAHQRSPRIAGGKLCFLHDVTHLDPQGGPWGRGYLRAVSQVTPQDWFFDGHFKNDPCMPGTLMFEGTLQAMGFYLASLGYTLDRDGWRFEPVPEEKFLMRCRGQVTPSSKEMVYEVFVEEVLDGDRPTLYADLLCTVDGLKAFHCRRMALRLVPDFPLDARPEYLEGHVEPKPVAKTGAFPFDYKSLLACAWGRPSDAFGPAFKGFDHGRRLPRLPGPPYHFMSRVTSIDGELGKARTGSTIQVEFDVDPNAWYFQQNGTRTMPYAVLLEAALQPCGWLASFIGTPLDHDFDLFFRNLDGTATQHAEVRPGDGVLTTDCTLTAVAKSAGIIIVKFDVKCRVGDRLVYTMDTVFGFFPEAALASQAGIPPTPEERAAVEAPSAFRQSAGRPGMPTGDLLMIDRVTGYWPTAGQAGLGRLRAEKDVDPGAWFFKAHFFQDPVQPGSLGLEAMLHALQFYMLERGMGATLANVRFEPIALDVPMTWKYRGQVRPHNKLITTELEITEVGEDFAKADAYLWVDGTRIYQGVSVGMRISGDPSPGKPPTEATATVPAAPAPTPSPAPAVDIPPADEVLDPSLDTWLADHKPTYVLPVLPFMSIVDRLAGAAAKANRHRIVVGLEDVHVKRWVALAGGPLRLKTELADAGPDLVDVTLLAWRDAANPELSRYEPVATGRVRLGGAYPAPPAALPVPADATPVPSPYESGQMFHGPAFQVLRQLSVGQAAASAVLAAASGAPTGTLNQVLLDGITHTFPGDDLTRWSPDVPPGMVGYPSRLTALTLHGHTPVTGEVRVEARFDGFGQDDKRFPAFRFQVIVGDQVWAEGRIVYILFPKGPLGEAAAGDRRAFLADRKVVPGMGLSAQAGDETRLAIADVRGSDWLPGTIARIYRADGDVEAMARQIAIKEHLARKWNVHPGEVFATADAGMGPAEPLTAYPVTVKQDGDVISVRDGGEPRLDPAPVKQYWRRKLGKADWPVEDLYFGLIERFVRKVVVADPAAFAMVRGRSVLYLANHQVGLESLLFSVIAAGLTEVPTAILAKTEHQTSWLGELIYHNFSYPGVTDPRLIKFFDRQDPASLPKIVAGLKQEMVGEGKSLMVHAAGTRSLDARTPVPAPSAAFIDLALEAGLPIVPVRFAGGLPVAPLAERLEFPLGFGTQDYYFGAPLWPEELAALPLAARKQTVADALNQLGPDLALEEPNPGDPAFAAELAGYRSRVDVGEVPAVMFKTLEHLERPSAGVKELLASIRQGRELATDTAELRWMGMLADWLAGRRERLLGGRKGGM